jgi:aminoglycoside phosphotransferase
MLLRQKLLRSGGAGSSLPAFGNIAIRVHRGYKIFDLDSSRVTKAFADGVSEAEARLQMDACRLASNIAAAPRFIAADSGHAWYTEEFIPGVHGTETTVAKHGRFMDFYPDVEACLLDLASAGPVQTVEVASYLEELTAPCLFDEWDVHSKAEGAAHEIRRYQAGLRRWLAKNCVAETMQLVLIHGDFSLVNVIATGRAFRVVDWEGIRYGNLFGDCYNFVFAEKYYDRARSDVTVEMAEIMQRYGDAALRRFPGLRDSVGVPQPFAMRLYYLERLRLLLQRHVSANLISVIRKSIMMFRDFDAAANFPELDAK